MPVANADAGAGGQAVNIEPYESQHVSQTTDLVAGTRTLAWNRVVQPPPPVNPDPEHEGDSMNQVPIHAASWRPAAGSNSPPPLNSLKPSQGRKSISTSTVREANGVVTTHSLYAPESALAHAKKKEPEIRAALARVGYTEEFQVSAGFDDAAAKRDELVEELHIYLDMNFVFEKAAVICLHDAFRAISAPYQGTFYFGKMSDGHGHLFMPQRPEKETGANEKAKWKGEGEDVEAVKRGRSGRTLADNGEDESIGSKSEHTVQMNYPGATLHIPCAMVGQSESESSTMPIHFLGGSINLPSNVTGIDLAESGCWRMQLMCEEDNGISAAMGVINLESRLPSNDCGCGECFATQPQRSTCVIF